MEKNKISILSIDPSLKSTGVYLNSIDMLLTINPKQKLSRMQKYKKIAHELQLINVMSDVDIVLVEDYSFGSKTSSTTILAEIKGIIFHIFQHSKIIIYPIAIWQSHHCLNNKYAVVKKGKKVAQNKLYVEHFSNKYDKPFINTDEVDAYLIYKSFMKTIKQPLTSAEIMVQDQYMDFIKCKIEK